MCVCNAIKMCKIKKKEIVKKEIVLAEAARAISAFLKTHSCNCKLIPTEANPYSATYTGL